MDRFKILRNRFNTADKKYMKIKMKIKLADFPSLYRINFFRN